MTDTREKFDSELISIVIPVYNEEPVLDKLCDQAGEALSASGVRCEFILVDDGSGPECGEHLLELARNHVNVRVLRLSRNFGQQAAIQAGLSKAEGDAAIIMDADFQDDPASLPAFVEKWREGYQVIYAIRTKRKEFFLKRWLFYWFYRLFKVLSPVDVPPDAGNFGLIDRRVVDAILELGEHDRFYPGLRSWAGFRQIGVTVERLKRYDDRARVTLFGLLRLAKNAIFSFSSMPLMVFYGVATINLCIAVALSSFSLYHKIFTGQAIPGWTSMIVAVCIIGGFNSLGIAILGEYILRIYRQVQQRPMFIIAHDTGEAEEQERHPSGK